jgi:DNA-binding GntR family transcriptional regulator
MAAVTTKQERIYGVLRERILEGTYGPGHRLVIDALARELAVSPMPVREAIRRLEAEGWVSYQANQGAQVAPMDELSWAEAMATLAVLEGYATAITAPHLRADDLERLRKINAALRASLDEFDLMAVARRNHDFHRTMFERCPNPFLAREMETIWERLNAIRSNVFIYIPTRGSVSADEHEQLLGMIERAAPAAQIERAAREHKLHTIAAYEQRRRAQAA